MRGWGWINGNRKRDQRIENRHREEGGEEDRLIDEWMEMEGKSSRKKKWSKRKSKPHYFFLTFRAFRNIQSLYSVIILTLKE